MSKACCADMRRAMRAAVIYGAVWVACLALYWGSLATGGIGGGAIMGYTALVLYIVLPVASAASAALIGRSRDLGRWRLVAPFASAALYCLFIEATFGLSTALGLTNIASADATSLIFGFAPAALGFGIGWACSGCSSANS